MEDQFASYEIAIKLKELGFDEPCLAGYRDYNGIKLMTKIKDSTFPLVSDAGYGKYCHQNRHVIKSPTWGQAFDWFREKYSLEGYAGLCHFDDMTYGYNITTYIGKSHYLAQGRNYKSYEEARVACLEKLIELCQKE